MRTIRSRFLRLVPVLILPLLGCGSGKGPLYPVEGTVTFEGKPLPGGGTIAFIPLENQAGKTAGGEIDEQGRFRLTTYSPGDGTMAGKFRVVITQVVHKEPEASPDGSAPVKPAVMLPPSERIPVIYSDHHNSPLQATVEARSPNELKFDLKRK